MNSLVRPLANTLSEFKWLRGCALALLVILPVTQALAENKSTAPRSNVIVILSDDQGYGDFSCHGNPLLRTPNLDRLHDEAIRFTDFHVAPMCTPTRGELMTGVDALRNGASSVCAGRCLLRPGAPTMAEIFATGGYRTALFGKWHLGDSYPNLPQNRGFHETVYHLGWGITSIADLWQNDYFDGRFRHNGKLESYPGYCTDVWFSLAMNWIREQQKRSEPFFLYLPTNAPHGPLWVPARYKEPYLNRGPAAFFGMIANLDENVGKLEALLVETGLRDNTIIIYMHDNGGTAGVNFYNAGLRGRKTTYYEGGHRAACFVRWPAGKLRSPGDVDTLCEVQDVLPTLIDLCGLSSPPQTWFDGISLAGVLRGKEENLPDRTLVVQYGQQPEKYDSAVLWRKWRLVHGKELYDLASDPGQEHDVATQHADVVKKLRDQYDRWWAGIEPKLNDFVPIHLGADAENPVTLTSAGWANVYCDNMPDVRKGVNRNGAWHVLVENGGTYQIGIRRWPLEVDAPISAAVPAFVGFDGGLPAGQALPIAKARLKLGNFDQTLAVSPEDKQASFTLPLKAGTKTQLQTWFYDAQGKELCGAYFAYVERK